MTHAEITSELTGYLEKMQTFDKDAAQDATALHGYLIDLTNMGARANFLKAEYSRLFRRAKKDAYMKLSASSYANDRYFTPSLAKDYIDSCCSESGYLYDLADRTAAQCVHTIDAIRTVVSSLRSERELAKFN